MKLEDVTAIQTVSVGLAVLIDVNQRCHLAEQKLAIAVDALQSISEYWRCARTMTDACEHNRNAAAEALAQIAPKPLTDDKGRPMTYWGAGHWVEEEKK